MAHFGILTSFDHNSQSWTSYEGRISQWFIANDIEDDEKKRAILLSALSESTYRLAADLALPKQLCQVTYPDIIQLLNVHFTPKSCGFGDRYNFYTATQNIGENYSQWAARLRGLTAKCQFSNIEEALRDRFLMGMLPGPERDKLFTKSLKSLTLANAVEMADSLRSAREVAASAAAAAAAAAGAPAQPGQHDQLFKISNSGGVKKVQCLVCGFKNHKSSECRYANYKCKKCHEKGHLRRMCKKVNYMASECIEEGEDDDDGEFFNIRSSNGEPMTEQVNVQGLLMKFQIDSGSAVTAISQQTYKKHFINVPLSLTSKRLLSYTGDKIDCMGVVHLSFTYAGKTHPLKVFVIRNGGPPLLGRDFISLFKLEMLPVNFNEEANGIIDELQAKYPSVFSDKLGKFNKYKVSLNLKESAKPIFFKARPVAYALKDKMDSEIDRLLQVGILKPVEHSEYASPVVPVLKRNGSIRLCADYSVTINKQLNVDKYPLPTAQELFTKLHGGQQFSKLDLSQAYAQFELDDESQKYTCINTHRGLFRYTRLAFGLASAPAIFQRAMDSILSGMEGVIFMLDDILVTGVDRAQHLERLKAVLKKLHQVGLTLQKEKCEFFKDQVEYLGYTIDKSGLKKTQSKIKAIVNAPVPTNVNKLQSFLGLVNYYRNFVPNASSILSPLYSLLQKGIKWNWNAEHDRAFTAIKQCLASDHVLAHFNPDAKIILTVDASPNGLGAILSQVGADGTERPISFASRTLSKAEKRYAQIQKEATAIVFGVKRFHQYLYGRSVPFTLRTDHKPLLAIFGPYRGIPEITANRLQRYAIFLSAYNYNIEYISSADNSADFLSRASLPECESSAIGSSDKLYEGDDLIVDRASYVNFVIDGSLPVTRRELCEETSKDVVLRKIISYILNGWPNKISDKEIRPYFLCRTQLSFEEGCVMRGHKVVVPLSLRDRLLSELHKSHLGIVKCKAEARSRFWFPGVDNALEKMIASCEICLQLRQLPARAPLAVWPYPPRPFYRIHADFLGPINNRLYLVVVDAYSKWVEAYSVTTTSSSMAIIKLQEFMARFGLPHTLVSDNDTAFTSQEFKSFCAVNGILHVTSPTYHPASNGQAESFVKIVKKGIKSSLVNSNSVRDANAKLLKYLFDYRNSIHSTTSSSPAELVFGRKLRSRLDLINQNSSTTAPPSPSSLTHNVKEKQCLQSKAYGGSNRQCFAQGDNILYKKQNTNKQGTWQRGIVIKKIGKVTYLVKDCSSNQSLKKHKNQMIPYKGSNDKNVTTSGSELDLDLEDFVNSDNLEQSSSSDPQGEPVENREQSTSANDQTFESVEGEDEFHEANNIQPQQNNERIIEATGMVLRSLPKVDYKRFFNMNL